MKAALIFYKEFSEILTGMLLSDARMQMNGKDAIISFGQKDKEFIDHLWDLCKKRRYSGAPPQTSYKKRGGQNL